MLFVKVLFNILVDWVVVLSPVTLPLGDATHVYVDGTSAVKEMLTVPPLQMVAELVLVIVGNGLTVTVTELLPGHSIAGSAVGSV